MAFLLAFIIVFVFRIDKLHVRVPKAKAAPSSGLPRQLIKCFHIAFTAEIFFSLFTAGTFVVETHETFLWIQNFYYQSISCNLYIFGFKIWTLEESNAFTSITDGTFVVETHETFLFCFAELMWKYGGPWNVASAELVPGQ